MAPRTRRVLAANIPEMTRVVVTGATGLIGRAVVGALVARGDSVLGLSRDAVRAGDTLGPGIEVQVWSDPISSPPPSEALAGADGVIHLLGEPIAQRWSGDAKQRILDSRVLSTRNLVSGLRALQPGARPHVLVSQSAVGYYGPRGEEPLDESAPPGVDFVADVVSQWESEALAARDELRVVLTRTGVVLSPQGGALAKMLPFFRLGIGGPVAGGRQYLPWVHLDDVVGAILFCLDDQRASGPVNVTAPTPVDNADFSRALGRVLKRPAVLPVPGFALSLLYGEMSEIVTTGQRAVPAQADQPRLHVRAAFAGARPARRALALRRRPHPPACRLSILRDVPLYDFVCARCEERFEARVSERERPVCPACGAGDVERVPAAFSGPFTTRPQGQDARRSDAVRRAREEQRRDARERRRPGGGHDQ